MPSEPAPPATRRVVLVAAYADNRVIGAAGGIPWHSREDFAHFKATTLGHTLVMGRATYDSIGRPLPGRTTVVVTRDPAWSAEGVLVAHSYDDALALAAELPGDVMVAGGAQIYALALPTASDLVLTEIHLSPEGDTFFPPLEEGVWVETRRESRRDLDPPLDWVWWERRAPEPA